MNIVFLDSGTVDFDDIDLSGLHGLGNVKLYKYSTLEEGKVRGAEADVIIVNKYVVDQRSLGIWSKCKYICVAATGYNNVNLEVTRSLGIDVSNVRGYSTDSVVQQVFASLLTVLNRPAYYFDEVRNGRWGRTRDFTFYDHSIRDLSSMTMGVIGSGDIGTAVANLAYSFGMKVIVSSRYPYQYSGKGLISSEEEVIIQSDVLSLHIPLTNQTKCMVNNKMLSKMKKDAVLINTSRGPIIDELALKLHLSNHSKFSAILDVLSVEPPDGDHPLQKLNNCYITPHIAWASKGARSKLIEGICANIIAFQGGFAKNIVN